jgi:hypothetical protein
MIILTKNSRKLGPYLGELWAVSFYLNKCSWLAAKEFSRKQKIPPITQHAHVESKR